MQFAFIMARDRIFVKTVKGHKEIPSKKLERSEKARFKNKTKVVAAAESLNLYAVTTKPMVSINKKRVSGITKPVRCEPTGGQADAKGPVTGATEESNKGKTQGRSHKHKLGAARSSILDLRISD